MPGEFPAQMASNTENVSIWWSHHYSDPNSLFYLVKFWFNAAIMKVNVRDAEILSYYRGLVLLRGFNFNPSMDK